MAMRSSAPTCAPRPTPTRRSTTRPRSRCSARNRARRSHGTRPTAPSPGAGCLCRCRCLNSEELGLRLPARLAHRFPYTAVDANRQVVGAAASHRFPVLVNFSPGLEWRFHFRGAYFGLRGVMENATDRGKPRDREQRSRLPAIRNLQRVPGPRLHRPHPADRGKVGAALGKPAILPIRIVPMNHKLRICSAAQLMQVHADALAIRIHSERYHAIQQRE